MTPKKRRENLLEAEPAARKQTRRVVTEQVVPPLKSWWVYLLRCGDGSLYCGIALDVAARLRLHQAGKGAKYTRGRAPLELVYCEACPTKTEALRRERSIKRLRREEKLRMCGPG